MKRISLRRSSTYEPWRVVSTPLAAEPTDKESPFAEAGKPTRASSQWTRSILGWTATVGVALLAAIVLRVFVVQSFWIPSGSMEPTLDIHDRVLVNRLSYTLHDVHRGDVVVFAKPADDVAPGISDLVKRVVGLPGETISARDGQVFVDGRYLPEPWLPKVDQGVTVFPSVIPGCLPAPPGSCLIPAGEYLMLGDNRTDSSDSRVFGPVPVRLFVGRAFLLEWPLSRLGTL